METIIICPGDPAGIGYEICAKAFADLKLEQHWLILALPSEMQSLLQQYCPDQGLTIISNQSSALALHSLQSAINESPRIIILDPRIFLNYNREIQDLSATIESHPKVNMGTISAWSGIISYASLLGAIAAQSLLKASVMVTGCINKESLRLAGVPHIGHTEILAALSNSQSPLTMFQTDQLRIFFLSRHLSLRQACDYVTVDRLVACLKQCHHALVQLGIPEPCIAVAGLNPHCGEHGLFGNEEEREIEPAIAQAKALGIQAIGPVGADSVFYQARMGNYDAVLSLYHDQGHIAAKTLDFDRTITMTLGLPFLRISVDHGTALDIAGKGIARSISMETAMHAALNNLKAKSI